jgi:dipeptidyl aminopeptidase/acylaminoacyl peptidase
VLYAAAWDGDPFRLYRKGPHSAASVALEFPDANLLAVSRNGQLAASLRPRPMLPGGMTMGTLALAPLEGGAPREVQTDVLYADWSPDGNELAVVRLDGGKTVLEFPVGKKIYETEGLLTYPRVSPKGDLVAVLDHPTRIDDRGTVAVIDRQGRKRTISSEWATEQGLAWHPGGEEIWFGAAPFREPHAIHAVTLSGESRVVVRAPGDLILLDVGAGGRALVTRESWRLGIMVRATGERPERDVSWLDSALLTGLSADGRRLLFTQFGPSVDSAYEGYVRRLDEASPMLLGEGFAQALSSDGSLVLSMRPVAPPELYVRPTGAGAGQPRRIVPRGLEILAWASWFPDGKRIVVAGTEPGHGVRLYACDSESGETRAITPEGVLVDHYQGFPVSLDGARVAAVLADGHLAVFSTGGAGEGRPIPNLAPGAVPVAWSADGRLFVYRLQELPARVLRVDTVTGASEQVTELQVTDAAGVHGFPSVRLTADGQTCAYSYFRALSELYEVEGLK